MGGRAKCTGFIESPVDSGVSNGGAERPVRSARTANGVNPATGIPVAVRAAEKYESLPESTVVAACNA